MAAPRLAAGSAPPGLLALARFAVDVDVERFERLAGGRSQADWREAIRQYGGEFLAGVYDEWAVAERERLRATYRQTLQRLVDALEAEGNLDGAVHHAEQLLRDDPLDEDACANLIRLRASRRRRASALHAYHVHAVAMARELGMQPDPHLQRIYRDVVRHGGHEAAGQHPPRANAVWSLPFYRTAGRVGEA